MEEGRIELKFPGMVRGDWRRFRVAGGVECAASGGDGDVGVDSSGNWLKR